MNQRNDQETYHDLSQVRILLLLNSIDLMNKLGVPRSRETRHLLGEFTPTNSILNQMRDILRRVWQWTSLVRVRVVDESHIALEGVKLLSELGIAVLRESGC